VAISIICTVIVLVVNLKGNHRKRVPSLLRKVLRIKQRFEDVDNYLDENVAKIHELQFKNDLKQNGEEKRAIEIILSLAKFTLQILLKYDEHKKWNENVVNEWQRLARRLDSIFLWIFTALSLFMSSILFKKIFYDDKKIDRVICGCD
jgi:hypothetical protein